MDTRPLAAKVLALANRFEAMAIGADKQPHLSKQIAQNHRRDASTLFEAVDALKKPLDPTPPISYANR